MASSVDKSKEDKIKDLLEEIDLHKFIRDDLLSTMGQCEEATEIAEVLRSKEIQLAELLGDPIPAAQAALTSPMVSPTPPALTSTPTPSPMPPRMPTGAFNGVSGRSGNMGDSFSIPHWPSAAPSPFATASRTSAMPSSPPIKPQDNTRKRPLSTSGSSPILQGASKRNASSQPQTRKTKMEEIDAEEAQELANNHRLYEDLIGEGTNSAANAEIRKDRDEAAKDIMSEFRLRRDAELARVLQNEENRSQLPMSHPRPKADASWHIPHRTQPIIKKEAGFNGFREPQPYSGIIPSSDSDDIGSDDGFEEIDADSFNARFGKQKARAMPNPHKLSYQYPSEFSNAQYIPGTSSGYSPYPGMHFPSPANGGRSLPWNQKPPEYNAMPGPILGSMPGSIPGAFPGPYLGGMSRGIPGSSYDQFDAAFDVVRNQQEIFDDDVDIAYVCLIASSAFF
jgi:hypothetical protein